MIDEAKRIKTRLLKSKDLNKTFNELRKNGYSVMKSIRMIANGNTIFVAKIAKKEKRHEPLLEVHYIDRNDETDYKEYILCILY